MGVAYVDAKASNPDQVLFTFIRFCNGSACVIANIKEDSNEWPRPSSWDGNDDRIMRNKSRILTRIENRPGEGDGECHNIFRTYTALSWKSFISSLADRKEERKSVGDALSHTSSSEQNAPERSKDRGLKLESIQEKGKLGRGASESALC